MCVPINLGVCTWHCKGSVIGFELALTQRAHSLGHLHTIIFMAKTIVFIVSGSGTRKLVVRAVQVALRRPWRPRPVPSALESFQSVASSHLCSQHVLSCSACASPIDELGYLVCDITSVQVLFGLIERWTFAVLLFWTSTMASEEPAKEPKIGKLHLVRQEISIVALLICIISFLFTKVITYIFFQLHILGFVAM